MLWLTKILPWDFAKEFQLQENDHKMVIFLYFLCKIIPFNFARRFTDYSYFSTKTYAVGTQKNSLDETVLLSTQNICFIWFVRKYWQF